MFLNIITPSVRFENLKIISDSIKIPKDNYRWIVVFDLDEIPSEEYIPNNCEVYCIKDNRGNPDGAGNGGPGSVAGNAQRNFALNLIEKGYVYFNDDDTTIHKDLWDNIKDIDSEIDFISFDQELKDGSFRLNGSVIKLSHTDSHNFISSIEIIGDIRWVTELYWADGIFAEQCYSRSNNSIYIPKILSTYNSLR